MPSSRVPDNLFVMLAFAVALVIVSATTSAAYNISTQYDACSRCWAGAGSMWCAEWGSAMDGHCDVLTNNTACAVCPYGMLTPNTTACHVSQCQRNETRLCDCCNVATDCGACSALPNCLWCPEQMCVTKPRTTGGSVFDSLICPSRCGLNNSSPFSVCPSPTMSYDVAAVVTGAVVLFAVFASFALVVRLCVLRCCRRDEWAGRDLHLALLRVNDDHKVKPLTAPPGAMKRAYKAVKGSVEDVITWFEDTTAGRLAFVLVMSAKAIVLYILGLQLLIEYLTSENHRTLGYVATAFFAYEWLVGVASMTARTSLSHLDRDDGRREHLVAGWLLTLLGLSSVYYIALPWRGCDVSVAQQHTRNWRLLYDVKGIFSTLLDAYILLQNQLSDTHPSHLLPWTVVSKQVRSRREDLNACCYFFATPAATFATPAATFATPVVTLQRMLFPLLSTIEGGCVAVKYSLTASGCPRFRWAGRLPGRVCVRYHMEHSELVHPRPAS